MVADFALRPDLRRLVCVGIPGVLALLLLILQVVIGFPWNAG